MRRPTTSGRRVFRIEKSPIEGSVRSFDAHHEMLDRILQSAASLICPNRFSELEY
jgi:hypothetical protein